MRTRFARAIHALSSKVLPSAPQSRARRLHRFERRELPCDETRAGGCIGLTIASAPTPVRRVSRRDRADASAALGGWLGVAISSCSRDRADPRVLLGSADPRVWRHSASRIGGPPQETSGATAYRARGTPAAGSSGCRVGAGRVSAYAIRSTPQSGRRCRPIASVGRMLGAGPPTCPGHARHLGAGVRCDGRLDERDPI